MRKIKSNNHVAKITELIIDGIKEKKGNNIVKIDLRTLKNTVCDYFIICHGDSSIQVEAIADSIQEQVFKKIKEKPWHKEGFENSEWILLDYSNIVVHIFQKEKRNFYAIEDLWGDAKIKTIKS